MESLFCCLFPILVFIGVGALAAADRHDRKRRVLRRSGLRASGRVVGHDDTQVAGQTAFRPIVGFRDEQGVERTFRMETASSSTEPPVGAEVPVLYQGTRPENAMVETEQAEKAAYRTPMIVGIVCVGLAAAIAIAAVAGLLSRIEVHSP